MNNVRKSRKTNWLITTAASLALGSLGATSAFAQYRVGSDGRANDANNRIGSGGLNQQGQINPNAVSGNQIITGNVTAGRQFRGFVPYTDPFAFRGRIAGQGVDNFARSSSGVPTGGISNFNATQVKPFYGEVRTVEVPPGYTAQPNSMGYVPSPTISRQPGDFRMGAALPLGTSNVTLPQPGQLILPGPVDPSTQNPTVITASPLYGVRQWSTANDNDMGFLNGLNEAGRMRLDNATIDRMQKELEQSTGPDGQPADSSNVSDASRVFSPSLSPMESPQNNPLSGGLANESTSGSPLGSSMVNNTGTRQRLLTSPAQQSTQMAELQRRLQQYQTKLPGAENEQANRDYQEQLREKAEKEGKAGADGAGGTAPQPPGTGGPATPRMPGAPDGAAPQPGATDKTDQIVPDYAKRSKEILEGKDRDKAKDKSSQQPPIPGSMRPTAPKDKPLVITSLAEGVQAPSLKDFLNQAESLMKQGKFYSALDQYESAEMIAPNNPMIVLGRANAELGASYYVRAEKHLRDAFMKDPALLMAQYDLKSFLGNDRLDFLVKDLKEVASTDKTEPRPVFLLAYIMYNTGNEQLAASWLDLAEKRAGKPDPFYELVRKHWVLPSDAPAAPEQNK